MLYMKYAKDKGRRMEFDNKQVSLTTSGQTWNQGWKQI